MPKRRVNVWIARIDASGIFNRAASRAVLLTALLPCPALAESSSVQAQAKEVRANAPIIRVTWIGTEPPSGFAERLASWFASTVLVEQDLGSQVDIARSTQTDSADSSRIWIDVSSRSHVHVYFAYQPNGQHRRYLVRDVEMGEGLTELGSERLAQLVYSSILALEQGRIQSAWSEVEDRLGTRPSASSRPTQLEPQAPAKATQRKVLPTVLPRATAVNQRDWSWFVSLAAGYGANSRGAEGMAHGPELWSMVGRGEGTWRLGAFASARYLLPVEPDAASITIRLHGLRLRVGGAVELGLSRRHWLGLGAGIGVDQINVRPRGFDTAIAATGGGWDSRAAATGAISSNWLTPIGTLMLLGELDLALHETRYVATTTRGSSKGLLLADRLQPGLSVLVRFDVPRL